jgi:DNA polymerase/3'-5' exonuclease PolX
MSTGEWWTLEEAKAKAMEFVKLLSPYCDRIEIAGSIRRQKKQVHDIDLVVIWKGAGFGLLKVWLENRQRMMKPTGGEKIIKTSWSMIPIQISVATIEIWPMILLVRTGSASFNRYLATLAKRKGMQLKASGYLTRGGETLPITCEQDIFRELGLKFREPQRRETP